MRGRKARSRSLPTKEQIGRFIAESPRPPGKRALARAFRVSAAERAAFEELVKAVRDKDGARTGRGSPPPTVLVVEIVEADIGGEIAARPVGWKHDSPPPRIVVAPGRRGRAPEIGERVLARLRRIEDDLYEARPMRFLGAPPREVLGVYRKSGAGGRIAPTGRAPGGEITVAEPDSLGARDGELVVAESLPGNRLGLGAARVRERLGGGHGGEPPHSLIAMHGHGIVTRFSDEALAEAEAAAAPRLGSRTDLREVPLVTIDPEDARDHDDAVWAEADRDRANPGGWRVVVAIADVAYAVRPGGALDREARERGNSVYFPDRVVPMLPEPLSADACSLKPGVDRACLALDMRLDREGRTIAHRFVRGLMRSAARLDYAQVQRARDGDADAAAEALMKTVIAPLYGAYGALRRARARREPLDIEVPEREVRVDRDGRPEAIVTRPRLDSHRLIEELMIAANVCAAKTLGDKGMACMYRIHDRPPPDKLEAVRDTLRSMGHRLTKGQVLRPALFNHILAAAAATPEAEIVNQVILRAQAQAQYSPENIGHFGLALGAYAHFTSPIRRYADLLVHRGLIAACGLGEDGLEAGAGEDFAAIGAQISAAERRAAAAEWEARDRFVTAFMAEREGAVFAGWVSGVGRFGLFVTLDEGGAEGLVPMRTLGGRRHGHERSKHTLVGSGGRRYALGTRLDVRLVEADTLGGRLRFEIADG